MASKQSPRAADQRRSRVNLSFHNSCRSHNHLLRDARLLAQQLDITIAELGRVGLALAIDNPSRASQLLDVANLRASQ